MKKALKITGITLASIIGVVIITVSIVCYIVFSPSKLTPIVRDQSANFLTCKTDLDTVDLTFFSTFPNFALRISNFALTDSLSEDTIVRIKSLSAEVNLKEFILNNNIIVNGLELSDGIANLYVDSAGKANFDIVADMGETEEDTTTSDSPLFDLLKIENVKINRLSANYIDESSGIDASLTDFSLAIDGNMQSANADLTAELFASAIRMEMRDSVTMKANISNLSMSADVEVRDNHITGTVKGNMPATFFAMGDDVFAENLNIGVNAPLEMNMDIMFLQLKQAALNINSLIVSLDGSAQLRDNDDIGLDMNFATNKWNIDSVTAIIPDAFATMLSDFKTLKGGVSLSGNVSGIYNDSIMPLVDAKLIVDNATVNYSAVPYKLNNVNANIAARLDLNGKELSTAKIHNISAKTGTMSFSVNGDVRDLLGNIGCNLRLNGDINLPELAPVLPSDLNVDMTGRLNAAINAAFTLDDIEKMKLEKIVLDGTIGYTNLDVTYNDSMRIVDNSGQIKLNIPSGRERKLQDEIIEATIQGSNLSFSMTDVADAVLNNPKITLAASNPLDTTKIPSALCSFNFGWLTAKTDSMDVKVSAPKGHISLSPSKRHPKTPVLTCSYSSDNLQVVMEETMTVVTKGISVRALTAYDEKQENILLKWNPLLNVDFNDGVVSMAELPTDILIPSIKFNFTPKALNITDSRIIIDDSDFSLRGKIDNIRRYIKGEDLLVGELEFFSEQTNVDQLMALVNGFGEEEQTDTETVQEKSEEGVPEVKDTDGGKSSTSGPFMVPKGVDMAFTTHINNAVFSNNVLKNIKGKLTVNDGKLVLEQMGFTSEAAEMQLTGVYRSDRENHLYAGFDFHLLNIDIKKLIEMIPAVDTIVPMLASFEGHAEFHFAGETYLNSNYEPKLSTLRAATAIEGKDLVLLDTETFSTISKYLMFSGKTRNVVDSISVEATVFRDEVDLYPFLISMDKWQAVIAGRHNLDMAFNYHISLTDCPLPVRLGLDIKGTFDDMQFKLVPCKYAALFKPDKRNATQERTLELKKIISDSLKANVKRESDDRLEDENSL